jgi:predicted nuclease with TOPRIM domain
MKEQLLQRLDELRSEFEAGQKMLAELETQQIHMKSSLLRISGAIQVLEELLSQAPPENQPQTIVEHEKIRVVATE